MSIFKKSTAKIAKQRLKGIVSRYNRNWEEVSYVGGYCVDLIFKTLFCLSIIAFMVSYYTGFAYVPLYTTILEGVVIVLTFSYFIGVKQGTRRVIILRFSHRVITCIKVRCSFIEASEEEEYIERLKTLISNDDKFVSSTALVLLSSIRQYEDDGFIKGQIEYLEYFINEMPAVELTTESLRKKVKEADIKPEDFKSSTKKSAEVVHG